jgi:hypothetical protein
MLHFMRRRWEQAEQTWDDLEKKNPEYRGTLFWRARLAIERQQFDQALTLLDRRMALGRANLRVIATAAYANARSGRRGEAENVLTDLLRQREHTRIPPLDLALVCLGLERWDEVLDWLSSACEERAAPLYQFAVDPIYDPIRSHARAEAVRLSIGLPHLITCS